MKKLTFLFLLVPVLTFAQTITLKGSLTSGNSGTDIWEYIDTNTGNVYAIVGGNGMSVVDVTDPTTPVQVAHLTNVPGFDVKVWSNYVYCGTSGGGNGSIVDVSDPTNPQIVGSFPSGHNIFIDDRGYMYNSSPGVRIYDLNPDPTSPQFLVQVGSSGHDVTVRGNLMMDCHGGSGTNFYDVTDPASPILLSTITDPAISYHHQGDISTNGNYAYICDEGAHHPDADISVWDISDISNPVRVSDVADPDAIVHNLYVIGDYAYTSYYTAGFKVFDVTDPSVLVLADEYDTNNASGENFGGAFGVYPSPVTANIYINDGSGVYIFGFSELNVFAKDVGVNNIINPNSGVLTNAEVVEISIRNHGLDPQSNIPLELRVDGNLITTETFTGTINSGETDTYLFTQTLDLSAPGQTYTIEVRTDLTGDEYAANDAFTKEVTYILGIEDISITQADLIITSLPNNIFNISLITDYGGEAFVSVFNMLGQELSDNNIYKEGDRYNLNLDMSGVSTGIYIIKMRSGLEFNIYKTARIIVK